ncbi:hypothetical protein EJ02DRAFT_258634 [Clathrospora elynae]|uniref:Uncharacterized protein n=1 Tax=Clathrospora elynae TaxID=706981 RepID=A0A6A5SIR7_9PLEO|nr:hypothetical protein EJ02DRAFT_258634 [Clathrospora elynae]
MELFTCAHHHTHSHNVYSRVTSYHDSHDSGRGFQKNQMTLAHHSLQRGSIISVLGRLTTPL